MIVDAHVHVWNRLDGMIANQRPVVPLGGGMIRIGDDQMLGVPAYMLDCAARAEYAVSEFDAAGVDMAVVVQDYMDGVQNDYLLEVRERFPGRFFAHALPNYWDADGAAAEAERLFRRGFRGLKLPGEHLLEKLRLDDPRLMPIWQTMEEDQYVLAVDLSEGETQVREMENILARFPKLRVALGHFGMVNRGGWPGQLHLCRHENVFMEAGGIIWLYRDEGYPFPSAIDAIHRAKEAVGIEKLMWGSDWPRTMIDFTYRQSIDFLRKDSSLTDPEKTMLLGGNAAGLYRLPEPQIERRAVRCVTED
ncbi:MAG: amidohydrolase family protein [Planctomycetota bacterium]|jgi:predicted TIM-barrel fold metal-dependent hydrolase